MTQEEIKEMIEKAGLIISTNVALPIISLHHAEKFAKLVAEKTYERGFIDGMQKQMQSSVDKAVNAMSKREWVGLTDSEYQDILVKHDHGGLLSFYNLVEEKLRQKNTE
jgi:hypothetical protein